MALMIHDGATLTHPSKLHENIFNILQTSPHTRDWVVFYQKNVHPAHPEIDFIILIPDYCSVICLEVENGLEESMWALRDQYSFFQEGGLPLLDKLRITDDDDPDDDDQTAYELVRKLEIHAGQLLQTLPEDRFPDNWINDDDLKAAKEALNELRNALEGIGPKRPETIFRSRLEETLRPQLLRLTEDQKKIIDDNVEEKSYVIDGAAGTGKTVLAMELAKRRCEAGDTVALLCSNPNLIRHLEPWAKELSDGEGEIVAGTPAILPSYAFGKDSTSSVRHQQRLDGSPELEQSLKFGYLEKAEWSSFIEETVKDLGPAIFDYLIVDEAQNLCDEVFLKLMHALLKNGLTGGRFTMFGDFTNQNIVTHNQKPGMDSLTAFIKRTLPSITLTKNCRNTHQIAEKVYQLADIKSPTLSGVYGPDVQIKYFESEEKLWEMLKKLVDSLIDRDFRSRQIILLSSDDKKFGEASSSVNWRLSNIREADIQAEEVVNPGYPPSDNVLRYSSIYDFQGLESDVAILVIPVTGDQTVIGGGVTLPLEDHLRKMLYTGMSRAKAMLIIVADKSYKKTLERRQIIEHPPSHR